MIILHNLFIKTLLSTGFLFFVFSHSEKNMSLITYEVLSIHKLYDSEGNNLFMLYMKKFFKEQLASIQNVSYPSNAFRYSVTSGYIIKITFICFHKFFQLIRVLMNKVKLHIYNNDYAVSHDA